MLRLEERLSRAPHPSSIGMLDKLETLSKNQKIVTKKKTLIMSEDVVTWVSFLTCLREIWAVFVWWEWKPPKRFPEIQGYKLSSTERSPTPLAMIEFLQSQRYYFSSMSVYNVFLPATNVSEVKELLEVTLSSLLIWSLKYGLTRVVSPGSWCRITKLKALGILVDSSIALFYGGGIFSAKRK